MSSRAQPYPSLAPELQPEGGQEGAPRAWGCFVLSHLRQPLGARALERGKRRYEEG